MKFLIILSFICLLFSCQKTETIQPVNRKAIADSGVVVFQQKLYKTQIDSIFNQYNFNGSVGVFKDTVELYLRNNGFADFKNRQAINNKTVFAIGSVSKQFTAVLILLKMEEGKLTLDDQASKYLKEFQSKEYGNITIHQLLNHTSGLNTLGQKLMFANGKDFHYSNDGYNALGKIIEIVTGKSYDENVIDLFKRAGLKNSSTGNLFDSENFAGAYLGNEKNFEIMHNMPKRLGGKEIGIAAGGILSTVDDLHRWNNLLYSGKIIQPETLKKFLLKSAERQHPIFGKMGYGYGIMMNMGKPAAYFHSGYIKGSPSLNIYYPETKTSVIILSNIADEEKGKSTTFKPHREIKNFTDMIERISTNQNIN
ncbi:beta-lactamase family protein [Chryseobacterium chendengshani]|uniref:serine hydrolase domain-containing protein n=1 Tax=Chryseobacterium sp. LJ668 TaxID=2864040 RepID=UPI001C6895B0|nr:serine hydrolase domain-containing protein [Chryseobacterium sp. LJ668]MBW8524684.1 beta-lactamase family protein [Chryseobacterium sp. LJ668]QYK15082.1 beta-lactamase family protein [Chryseobacterium sp. LJ668]